MAGSDGFNNAKATKKDEFYTRKVDIENELSHYAEHFENKVVYLNCDDPKESEFWQFFVRNFRPWKIKKLIATHYEPDEKNYAYKLELSEDTNGDGKIDWLDEPILTQLPCNGDFRSAACIELLKEADIVVTNPPFSLWREYVAQLIEYDKKFVILGNLNAITYKDIFAYLMSGKMWAGYSFNKTFEFIMPDSYVLKGKAFIDKNGKKHGFVPSICWYTNIDIDKRHEFLDLRGNYYTKDSYQIYDNYHAINIELVSDIPCDYDGIMGVPITFFDKYNPEQFEILGLSGKYGYGLEYHKSYKDYDEIIQNPNTTRKPRKGSTITGNPMLKGIPAKKSYYKKGNDVVYSLYGRIFIRNRNPQERKYPDEN